MIGGRGEYFSVGGIYRADPARTHVGEASGTGLGLSIVRAVADVHGGDARAVNDPGGGAQLRVTLPAGHAGTETPFG